MRYVDYALAWILLITAIVFILVMEITHLRGAILDVPFLWLVIVVMNFLRLRNSHTAVPGLKTSCISANLIGLTLEVVRFGLFGVAWLRYSGTLRAAELLGTLYGGNDRHLRRAFVFHCAKE
jgi:hypothetical protein